MFKDSFISNRHRQIERLRNLIVQKDVPDLSVNTAYSLVRKAVKLAYDGESNDELIAEALYDELKSHGFLEVRHEDV